MRQFSGRKRRKRLSYFPYNRLLEAKTMFGMREKLHLNLFSKIILEEKKTKFQMEKLDFNRLKVGLVRLIGRGLKISYAIIPAGLGAAIMLVVALLVNNIPKTRRYPEFWL